MTLFDPSRWPAWTRWASIPAAIGFLILINNARSAVEGLEWWLPAHRGFVLTVRDSAVAKRDQQLALAEARTQDRLDDLAREQRMARIAIETMSLRLLEENAIRYGDLVAAAPGDVTLRARLSEIQSQIDATAKRINWMSCEIERETRPAAVC